MSLGNIKIDMSFIGEIWGFTYEVQFFWGYSTASISQWPIPLSSALKDRHRGRVWETLPQDREIPLLLRLTKSVAFKLVGSVCFCVVTPHCQLSTAHLGNTETCESHPALEWLCRKSTGMEEVSFPPNHQRQVGLLSRSTTFQGLRHHTTNTLTIILLQGNRCLRENLWLMKMA